MRLEFLLELCKMKTLVTFGEGNLRQPAQTYNESGNYVE